MFADGSPLRRLPAGLDRKQALFLDGIRHATELADLAYERLVTTLTELAKSQFEGKPKTTTFTAPFLDAWAIVDSIDRLRGLVRLLPGAAAITRTDGQPGFHAQTETIRKLRNVSDHLAQRADYVVTCNSTALGVLSWVTLLNERSYLACLILPGMIANSSAPLPNLLYRTLIGPTDFITLAAGEHSACLSDAMNEMHRVVGNIENSLGKWIQDNGFETKHAPHDMLVVAEIELLDQNETQ